jgi:hypothetical protein
MTLPPEMWSESLAGRAVTTYRRYNAKIAQRWKWLDGIIGSVWMTGTPNAVRFAPVVIGRGYIEGPGGLRMHYHQPRFDMDTQEYVFNYGPRTYKMYGAKMLENIVQFLARIKVMNDALRISDRGFNFVSQSHDELAWIVPDSQVDECMTVALEEMRRPPSWAEGLPLDAECSFGQNYGEAKT